MQSFSPQATQYKQFCLFLRSSAFIVACLLVAAVYSTPQSATGQEKGAIVAVDASAVQATPPGLPPPNGQPGAAGQTPPGTKPAEGAEKKDGPSEPIKRTAAPPEPPNKRELDVKPDDEGKVQFQFRNQAWPDVLKWLAETSQMSLDWQELPGDYLNLATRRPYTIEETRDLFNRHLLLRGFTLLELEGVLQISKTENINPTLVPKVSPDALATLPPHRFVRTSFTLDTLVAEEVIEEFKSLMSSNGKLISLQSTNRLEAMDAAGNLHELYKILKDEQSQAAIEELAREFILVHVRSLEVKNQLEVFLGIQKSSSPSMGDPNQMAMMQQQMMQQQQQMMQQMQQQAGQGGPNAKAARKRQTDVFLVANPRQNSVIVHAPPDKMAIIASFIARIDVPSDGAENMQMLDARIKVYRLASISPKQLVASLISMDALEPKTRLDVDEENNAIIAHASIADHYSIQQVIDRLDGSARKFDVIQLRRLKADDVAGTIKFLMGADKDKKDEDQNRRRFSFYDPWGMNNNNDKKKKDDSFRVGANIEDNQILLWANEIEREEINKLLIKLGEIPAEGSSPNPFRTIDASRSPETLEYLKKLQEKWKSISPNPIVIPPPDEFQSEDPRANSVPSTADESNENGQSKSENKNPSPPAQPNQKPGKSNPPTANAQGEVKQRWVSTGDNSSANKDSTSGNTTASDDSNSSKSTSSTEKFSNGKLVAPSNDAIVPVKENNRTINDSPLTQSPPAIRIQFDSDGNLMLSSQDLEALDKLESLMLQDAPPKRPYDVFQVRNTRASWIVMNLEDYFKDDKKKSDPRDSLMRFLWFDEMPEQKKSADPQLGNRKPLKFISDNDTNTIVATGASDAQRILIKELIELWDTPDKNKAKDARYTKMIPIRYSRAEAIEQAIKDVYRDFLSSNDKAFENPQGPNGKGVEQKRESGTNSRKFSLGVDKVTNIIVVSAEGEDFLRVICDMVEQLDQAAKPSGTVQVMKVETNDKNKSMEKALKAILESSRNKLPPNQQVPGQQGQQGQQGNQGNGQAAQQ